jgi:hypothetical protein
MKEKYYDLCDKYLRLANKVIFIGGDTMDFEGPINKVITIVIVAAVAPIAMTSFNAMNVTGFTTTQITIVGLMGLVVAFVFLRLIMKE